MLIAKVARSAPDLRGMSLAHLLARTEEDRHAQISQCSNGVGCCPARRVRTGDNFGAAFRQTNVLHIQRAREAARAYAATGQVLVPSRRSRDWRPSGTGAECRRKTLYGTFFAIPAERLDPAPAPEVRFIETPAGTPPAIKEWWNQGELIGREFIYPRQEAMLLAKSSSRPVLTTKSNTTTVEQTKNADLSRLSPNGQETNVNANDKPQASAPTGATQVGEVAPITIVIVAAPRR